MAAIYVLDVPEFRSLVSLSTERDGYSVTRLDSGYFRIESPGAIEFTRKELKFEPAIWYGCITGGLRGRIAQFDRDTLRVVDAEPA